MYYVGIFKFEPNSMYLPLYTIKTVSVLHFIQCNFSLRHYMVIWNKYYFKIFSFCYDYWSCYTLFYLHAFYLTKFKVIRFFRFKDKYINNLILDLYRSTFCYLNNKNDLMNFKASRCFEIYFQSKYLLIHYNFFIKRKYNI